MEQVIGCFKHEKEIDSWKDMVTFVSEEVLQEKIAEEKLEAALILTDDRKIVDLCSRNHIACGVILHENNKDQSFPMGAYCMEMTEKPDSDYLLKVYQREKNIPWTILETERLILREITPDDVKRLYELYKDPEITAYMEDLFEKEEEEIAYTKDYINHVYRFYGYGIWVVILKETGELIGRAGVESKDGMDGLELGFMLGKAYQHKGYAYEICDAIIKYANEELEEKDIRAMVRPENTASRRLCEKLKMFTNEVLHAGYFLYKRIEK